MTLNVNELDMCNDMHSGWILDLTLHRMGMWNCLHSGGKVKLALHGHGAWGLVAFTKTTTP